MAYWTLRLPNKCVFNVAYVLPEKTLTIDARTYTIDFGRANSTGHWLGLKFVNDHKLKFRTNYVYRWRDKSDYASGLISKFGDTQLMPKDLENNTRYKYAIKTTFAANSSQTRSTSTRTTLTERLLMSTHTRGMQLDFRCGNCRTE